MSHDSISADAVWLAALRAAGRSPHTLASYSYAVEGLKAWRGDEDITTVQRLEALRYVQHLTDSFQPGGVALRVRSLRACYSWLIGEEMYEGNNPFSRITISVPAEAKLTASDDEIAAMLDRAKGNRRDTALIVLLVDTGARKHEVAALTLSDVDLTSGTVRFPVSKTVIRTVPLTDRAVVALGRWLRERGTGAGSLWRVSDPYGLVGKVVKRHSRGALSPHALRRAFAVAWLDKGGSELGLQRICGWSSLEMVRRYTAASADRLASDEMRRLMAVG